MIAIGIDLGTCYTSIGYLNGNSFQIIENSSERKMLNYVAFKQNGREIGESLKAKIRMNYNKMVFDSKLFIGSNLRIDSMNYPFKLIEEDIKIKYQIDSVTRFIQKKSHLFFYKK